MQGYSKNRRPDSFVRVHLARVNAIGPGKADLLEAIAELGSIAQAASRLGMSYRRAWNLVRAMNAAFRAPLITASKGGSTGGGARLTATGREILLRYRRMEARAAEAIAEDAAAFRKMIRGK